MTDFPDDFGAHAGFDRFSLIGEGESGRDAPPTTGPTRFGRGWIPADRDIGLPGDGVPGDGLPPPRVAPHDPVVDDIAFVSHHAWDADRKVRFLHYLADKGDVRAACARVGMSRQSAYLLRRRDGAFAQGWQAALVLARRHVEEVLATRALDGVEEAIWFRGELVGTRRRYDARLLLAHIARLDRLAEAPAEGREGTSPVDHADRFDEALALIAGENAAAEFPGFDLEAESLERGRAEEGKEQAIDPLRLPPVRAAYVLKTAEAALIEDNGAWHDICGEIDADFEEQHHCWPDSKAAAEFPPPEYPPEPDYADYHRASAARWDGWQGKAFGRVDAALSGGEGADGARADEDTLPMEYKSMTGPVYDPRFDAVWFAGGQEKPGGDMGLDRVKRVNRSARRRICTSERCMPGSGNGMGMTPLSL